ncbi:MAG: M14 family zinc carboxypeptidase [Anaerolineae bacterium]
MRGSSLACRTTLLLLTLLLCISTPGPAQSALGGPIETRAVLWPTPHAPSHAPDRSEPLHIAFTSQAELTSLAQRLDIWEIVRDERARESGAGYLVAGVTPADRVWLGAQAFSYESATLSISEPETIPDYSCYRTIAELTSQLELWAATYPELSELRSVGTSYEKRPLYAMQLTNEATGTNKPIFFLMANIHGRELITPETAMVFIETLLTRYAVDPDITALLDHVRIEVMVSANPDGHVRNEVGEPWVYWRKNANPTNGNCSDTTFGVDLNRNSSYHWGGASVYPCAETYQGPYAVSETETQAVQAFLQTLFPDRRPDDDTTPAPTDTKGLFITLHSYSNLVLWPWGYTSKPAPNSEGLARLGHKLATFNGYTAQQAVLLYPTTGTTDDFAYGDLGVASYTFEIGSGADGFYPSCDRYDALIQPNIAALLYAAQVARAPYLLPSGPDALDVSAAFGPQGEVATVVVTTHIDGRDNGGEAIARAEAYLDVPPWDGGEGHSLEALDGAYDEAIEEAGSTLLVDGLTPGQHLVFVRGQDANGAWGPVSAAFVTDDLTLTPLRSENSASLGETVVHRLDLTNAETLSRTVVLTATDATWFSTLVPTTTYLSPGSTVPVFVTVSIPSVGQFPDPETLTITARHVAAPWFEATAVVETHALWATVALPLVTRTW